MARLFISAAVLAAAVIQVQAGATCGPGQALCPSSAPCCSEFGFCQVYGPYCLGGCNPLSSHALDSCRPMPICRDKTYTFAPGNPTIINGTSYDGNSTAYDWTIDGGTPLNTNNNGGELALILTQDGRAPKGTRVSTTDYLLYGTITATMKTSKWNGVIGAFITMSNIKIDWEWPGNHPTQAQSNFFWQGHVDYTAGHGGTHDISSDSYDNYHDYTINWQPDQLQFSIDGNVVRTVSKEETMVDGVYQYPMSPARVQLSIWPGGLPDSPQGVVTWSGGLIQYNEPEYVAAGNQYQVLVSKVVVQCSTSSGLDIGANTVSYMYGANDTSGLPTVYASNRTALLNDGSARYSLPFIGASAWSLIALAVGAGTAFTF